MKLLLTPASISVHSRTIAMTVVGATRRGVECERDGDALAPSHCGARNALGSRLVVWYALPFFTMRLSSCVLSRDFLQLPPAGVGRTRPGHPEGRLAIRR